MLPWLWGRSLGLCNMEQHIVFWTFLLSVCTYQVINWPIYINRITTGIVSSASDICHFTCTLITKSCHRYIQVMIIPHSSHKYICIHHPWGFYNYFSFTFIIYWKIISARILHMLMCSALHQLIHGPWLKVFIK